MMWVLRTPPDHYLRWYLKGDFKICHLHKGTLYKIPGNSIILCLFLHSHSHFSSEGLKKTRGWVKKQSLSVRSPFFDCSKKDKSHRAIKYQATSYGHTGSVWSKRISRMICGVLMFVRRVWAVEWVSTGRRGGFLDWGGHHHLMFMEWVSHSSFLILPHNIHIACCLMVFVVIIDTHVEIPITKGNSKTLL